MGFSDVERRELNEQISLLEQRIRDLEQAEAECVFR